MSEYVSTRDEDKQEYSYSEALLQGLAPDRGLFVPTVTPELDITKLQNLNYVELYSNVKSLFIGEDFDLTTQADIASKAYSENKFSDTNNGNITPVREVSKGLYIQELSLGPTASFKDMAMQPLAHELQVVLDSKQENLNILGATSGDTGSAAEAAFKGLKRISLFMLSPKNSMSSFQKYQMAELSGDNIFNISIDGRFDDCQEIVKNIKQDPEFANLGAVNSINWGRIASQIPYYFSGYLQVVGDEIGKQVDFVVPTGNFGNIYSGFIARKMGLPIRKLIVANNENSVVDRLIQTGVYQRSDKAKVTSSPSMDITVASNYERLVYDLLGQDSSRLRHYMTQFEATGKISFEDIGMPASALLDIDFDSGVSTARDRLETIRWVYENTNTVIDPHTADAVTVARFKQNKEIPIVCLSTALPVKFESTIYEALGFIPMRPDRFMYLGHSALEGFKLLKNDSNAVKEFIRNNLL